MFFCLSGYVIGYAHPERLASGRQIVHYLKRRWVRLYPIYLCSLAFSLVYMAKSAGLRPMALLKYLSFAQSFTDDGYFVCNPLWSLGYEVLYYLLFIPLSYFRVSRWKTVLACLVMGMLNLAFLDEWRMPLFSYLFGFAFWVTGLALAERHFQKEEAPSSRLLLSHGLLLGALWFHRSLLGVIVPTHVVQAFAVPKEMAFVFKAIGVQDLFLLPVCVYVLAVFRGIPFMYKKACMAAMYIIPAVVLAYLLPSVPFTKLWLPLLFYLLALVVWVGGPWMRDLVEKGWKLLVYSGSISYAMYVMHFPLLMYFNSVPFVAGSWYTVLVRLMVYGTVLVGISAGLEKWLQPRARGKF